MQERDATSKRTPWPFPAGAQKETVPERKNPEEPSTAYEYPNGDRGDKSGKNLEQQEEVKGTP